ncbi:MAG TPA: hypothetical protein VEO00_07495 [Actinomycetota bacterium]|nr:hypothetical protein [Actinomycetota bacterium]
MRVPRLALDRPFTYRLPEGLEAPTGSLVAVPFHGRVVEGWVLGPADEIPDRVADVRGLRSGVRFFDERLLALYRWFGQRYVTPLASAIDRGIPPRVVSEEPFPVAPAPGPPPGPRPERVVRYEGGGHLAAALEGGSGTFLVRPLPDDEAALAIEAIGRCLAGGRDAVLLVPEAHPLPHTAAAVRDAFGDAVCVFLQGEPRARYRAWLDVLGGRYRVVIGSRPAVFAPLPSLGLVWISREAHAGHREDRSPAYHVRDVGAARARLAGAVLVAASLCPSAEAVADPSLEVVRAGRDAEQAAWPVVETVRPGPEGRARRLVALLKSARSGFLLSSRPGYGVARVCRACGEPAACAACGGVLEQARGRVTCRACGAPGRCAHCGATDFGVQRRGAERVAEWAARIAPVPVREGAAGPAPGAVTVGTAAAVNDVGPLRLDVVGILDADRMRLRPGLAGPEQALATWFEAAAWAGPRGGGHVVVETAHPGDPVVQALVRSDPWYFHARERARREEAGFPPGFPVFRVRGGAGLTDRLEALDPLHLLVAGEGGGLGGVARPGASDTRPPTAGEPPKENEGERVCLVTVRPESLAAFGRTMRDLARAGEVTRVDAEPHL